MPCPEGYLSRVGLGDLKALKLRINYLTIQKSRGGGDDDGSQRQTERQHDGMIGNTMLRRVFFYPSSSRGLSFSPVLMDWSRAGHDCFVERKGPRQTQRRRRGSSSRRDDDRSRAHDNDEELQYYGFSNFQRILQNHAVRRHPGDAKPRTKRSSTPRRRDAGPGVTGVTPEPTPNYVKFKRIAGDDLPTPNEAVSLGDVKETNATGSPRSMSNRRKKGGVAASFVREKAYATTSSWVLVENTPDSANVSDLYESLNEILEFELSKGIIDLDGIQNNEKARAALEDIGALESLYTTQAIESGDIPLWAPDDGDSAGSGGARCPLLVEARPYLSYWARPTGFFLRLPNRSVAHALLRHVERAGALVSRQKWRNKAAHIKLGSEREEWVTGLWKRVQADYEQENADKRLQGSSRGEAEMVAQDLLGEDLSKSRDSAGAEEGCGESSISGESDSDEVFDFLQEYTESNPYPLRTATLDPDASDFSVLRCGALRVSVKGFVPFQGSNLDTRRRGDPPVPTWEQHAFEISGNLRLSDSIVRVVTNSLIRLNELQHFFRHCDLEATWPTEEQGVADCFRDIPSSIGWNLNGRGRRSNVDLLLSGVSRGEFLASKKVGLPKAKKNTYLVRFASPSAARMAVRNYQGAELKSRRWNAHDETYSEMRHELKLAQYPSV